MNILSRMNYAQRQAYRESRKAEIAEQKARKQAAAMTCQCCGRQIFAQRGKIAHHGYERPGYGWQTASCMGALYLPFEVARERLADLIVALQQEIENSKTTLDLIRAEKVKLGFTLTVDCEPYYEKTGYARYQKTTKQELRHFSRNEWADLVAEGENRKDEGTKIWATPHKSKADPDWYQIERANRYRDYDDMKEAAITAQKARIASLQADLDMSNTRFTGWKQTHTGFDKKTKEWRVKG